MHPTYKELLERALQEDSSDIVAPVASTLGIKRKEAADKIGDLSIDDALELVDAVDRDDSGFIMMAVDNADDKEKEKVEKLSEAPMQAGRPIAGQPGSPAMAGQRVPPGQRGFAPAGQKPMGGNVMPTMTPQMSMQQQAMMVDPSLVQSDVAARDMTNQNTGGPPQQQQPQQPMMTSVGQAPAKNMQPQPAPGTVKRPTGTTGTIGESAEFAIGDEVNFDGGDAVVKVPAAGRNGEFVGVLKDGKMVMASKSKVKRMKRVDEHVLGMTNMPNLRRMMELAGMKPGLEEPKSKKPWEKDTEETNGEDKQSVQQEQQPTEQPKEQQPDDGTTKMTVGIEVHDLQTGQTQTVAAPNAAAGPQAPVSTPTAQEPEQEDPRSEINSALDTIERLLPELKVGDFKDVRKRIDMITANVLNEQRMNRRRKL